MQSVWVSMAFFALVGGITPGPVNVIASSLGARWGWSAAWPHVLGASLGYCAMVGAMGSGLQLALAQRPELAHYTQWLGATYLLYLAFRIGTSEPSGAMDSSPSKSVRPTRPQALWGGFLTQTLNPKGWLVAMSGVGMFVAGSADETLYLQVFCVISFMACFVAVSAWAGLGLAIKEWMADPQHQRWFNRACGLALAACVWPMVSAA
ncbi:LysE family translocator [Rhodoferax aquaticus]|uniref:LysE family translocator n=2 Tax=Rhodoferax aquaticus TaxID=2527691 RepID=A0A515EMU6_9BURK|nr:LysE family translocator [Rhodoferax aquaticus]